MKVENIKPISNIVKPEEIERDKKPAAKDKVKENAGVVFEKSTKEEVGHVYDKNTIANLKRDSEKAFSYLRRIVEDMLKRQGKTLNLLNPDELIEIDETARLEAQELIGPNGELGVEAVSQRIVDFAIALSGGDKSKLDTLRKAIDQGFEEASKILGGLPDISRQTHKAIMEKLDAWEQSE